MPLRFLYFLIPTFIFLMSLYSLLNELLIRRLQKVGKETEAKVVSVDHTVAFGFRRFLGVNPKKPNKERTFGCDYIVSLEYVLEDGREMNVQTTVPARMRVCAGERIPYLKEGDVVPIRYSERSPQRLVVMLQEVVRRQQRPFRLIEWMVCTVVMGAILVTMALMLF